MAIALLQDVLSQHIRRRLMNDATFTTSSDGNRYALHSSRFGRRWAKAFWILGVATLTLGACASVDDASTDGFFLGEHKEALTTERKTVAEASSVVGGESTASAEMATEAVPDDVGELDGEFFEPESDAMSSRSIGSTDVGGFGELNAFGCWNSTCCVERGTCCLDTIRGRKCWSCCVRSEPCEKCIWPY
jgi:hypothetical protein